MLITTMFSTLLKHLMFQLTFNLMSANAFNLDKAEIALPVNKYFCDWFKFSN